MNGILFYCSVLGLIVLYACASQAPPSGGPVDKTPPRVINVMPANKSTNVSLNQLVEFEFSESMDKKTAERSVFISPDPGERAKIKWKGHKLRIEFSDSLDIDRTYVITLGTDLKDSHGNALGRSYTLAFSTGEEISDAKISGKIYSDESPQGILIWAYILDSNDEPDPQKKAGDYATQTDSKGNYELSSLSVGNYRIFAIRDTDGNRFYEKGVDEIAVFNRDIQVMADTSMVTDINFKMEKRDTIGPALISVAAEHHSELKLRFDEILDKGSASVLQNYKIRAKEAKPPDTLAIRFVYLNEADPQEVIAITEPQIPKIEYILEVVGVMDASGNAVDPEFKKGEFVGSALPDTFRPKIVTIMPADSSKDVFLNSTIDFVFSEAVVRDAFEKSFSLSDSSGFLSGQFEWSTPASVGFKAAALFKSRSRYNVTVKLDSVFDINGNAVADSTLKTHFTTLNADTLSELSGVVSDQGSSAQGRIFLTLSQNSKGGQTYEIQLTEPGPYKFRNILPGIYSIQSFRDRDENGKYSFGQAFPFQPAERFVVYPDTVKIRSGWPNEGNNIVFKK